MYILVAKNCKLIAKQSFESGEKIKIKLISFDCFVGLIKKGRCAESALTISILRACNDLPKMKKIQSIFLG